MMNARKPFWIALAAALAVACGTAGYTTFTKLEATDDLLVGDDATITGDLAVTGTTELTGAQTFTGAATFSSTVGVTGVTTLTGAARIVTPVMAIEKVRFCGNGPNATTDNYIGPVRLEDYENAGTAVEDDFAYGGGGCDAQDNTTIGDADEAVDVGPFALKAVGIVCVSDCGTDDTMTCTLYDDTAAVTGITCDITLDGTGAQCSAFDTTPATIAAGSALAVGCVNDTDDDCSSEDVECWVYFAP